MGPPSNEATFELGKHIFSEGDTVSGAYVIKTGKVELSKRMGEGKAILSIVEKGGIVGEMALVDNKPAEVSALALEPVTALTIDRSGFEHACEKASPILRMIIMALTQRLRERTRDISKYTPHVG